jgi:anti-anti-sigma factor
VKPLAQLTLNDDRETTIASLEGEIDLSNAEALRHQIVEAVPNHAFGLVVDLTDVSYMDSSGVRLLFDTARRLERRQQRLATISPAGSPVRELLVLVGGADRLGLHESLDHALASVRVHEEPHE